MAKRVMKEFRIDEISAVDSPAQKGARMTIMKRASASDKEPDPNDPLEGQEGEEEGSQPGKSVRGKDKSMSDDMKKAAELEAQIADLTKKLDDVTKAKAEADAKVAGYEKAAEIAKTDETFSADGVTIRKSEVGESSFRFMKAQQEKLEKAELSKRAEAELPHLPGTTDEKVGVLKAIGGMDEAVRKSLETMLKAGQAALGETMKAAGHNRPDALLKAEDRLDVLAKAYKEKHNIPYEKAYAAVLDTDEGRKAYAEAEAAKPRAA